jgi:hypothetical protein
LIDEVGFVEGVAVRDHHRHLPGGTDSQKLLGLVLEIHLISLEKGTY